ncbi:hypothetical protein G7Z17_g10099 [Cylindrodendrum hubeiense]|uniref:Integral membrane protein n=1 Tax=Cylindrodendrum hubeiense TaxID=595255 RepID=A0A9P5LCN5_9HYPO|nr:hypothetical protein G7Z17_g10099 [Cylindrodendrum hubeiense]
MALNSALSRTTGALIIALAFLPLILAHGSGHDEGEMANHGGEHHEADKPKVDPEYPPTYFSHADHVGTIYAHIAIMTLAWVFVLPVAVMLSLARSRFTLALQFLFLATNAVGLLVGTIYNAQTPDLYPNNAHHKMGWVVTWIVAAQVLISAVGWVAGAVTRTSSHPASDSHGFLPVPTNASHVIQYRLHEDYPPFDPYRLSDDSGQGTEPNTESLRNSSVSTLDGVDDIPLQGPQKEYDDDEDLESMSPSSPTPKTAFGRHAASLVTSRVWKYFGIGIQAVDRIILPLGSIVFATGIVTFGRFFEGDGIFNGLAHWVKGGVFFWLGLFTLGRWSGSFAKVGWAWNVRPKQCGQEWRPSAEFVESALIFFYGSTNIFLEHLSGWGGEWSARDMEHISITVLFIGGGLPPKSILPSRPPTELLASFGLISGGIIFMASAGDTVQGMIHYDLDAMFMYTITMGLVGLLMAWEVIVLAIKGWAVRRERRHESHQVI